MSQPEIIKKAPELILSYDHSDAYANQNLKNLSPVHILLLTNLITHWQNSRNLISETNIQSPEILPELTSGEVDEAEEAILNLGPDFDNDNYAKELTDILVFLQMMTEVIGDGYSVNAILAAVDRKIILANSSSVYEKTREIAGDIRFFENTKEADKKAIFEVYTTVLALYMSAPNLPDIVVAMYKTVQLNMINYPREYFEIDSQKYDNKELVELYKYRKSLCRVLRDEGMIGKDVDLAIHRKNVLVFADLILNEKLELSLAMQLLKERIIKIKGISQEEYKILIPTSDQTIEYSSVGNA